MSWLAETLLKLAKVLVSLRVHVATREHGLDILVYYAPGILGMLVQPCLKVASSATVTLSLLYVYFICLLSFILETITNLVALMEMVDIENDQNLAHLMSTWDYLWVEPLVELTFDL